MPALARRQTISIVDVSVCWRLHANVSSALSVGRYGANAARMVSYVVLSIDLGRSPMSSVGRNPSKRTEVGATVSV